MEATNAKLAEALAKARRENLKPPPTLDLVQWADTYRFLSAEASSEPGRWKTSRVEVARGPMMAVTEPGVREITVMSCTQLMKTEVLLNIIGYFIHQDPAPMLLLQPTVNIAKAFSKDRVDSMCRDTPALRGRVRDKKSRDSGNTMQHKQFPGGHLTMVGANAPGDLAMRPVRVVLCDEVDKYPASAGDEGDPIKLAAERSATFWNRLIVKTCSPTIEGASRIALEYEQSDRRVFEVPCPHCDHRAEMRWENVIWPEGEPDLAMYACPECGALWKEAERQDAIGRGTWRATAPFRGHAGFKASKLASPWEPIGALAVKFERAQGNPELLKTFYNTQLAETYKDQGEKPAWEPIYERREEYPIGTAPADVAFLTCGVDVQKDRWELEIVGWCPGRRSYSVDYRVILGDTANKDEWGKIAAVLFEKWPHASGVELPLRMMCIDSGYRTSEVYAFCRQFGLGRVAPVKGKDDQQPIISSPRAIDFRRDGKAIKGVKIYTVGVSTAKAELYGWLKLERPKGAPPPAGWCHFPQYSESHFKELTSEHTITKLVRGYAREQWTKTPGLRNEPLDCRVYARAAAAIVGMDRMKPADWTAVFGTYGLPAAVADNSVAIPLAAPPEPGTPEATIETLGAVAEGLRRALGPATSTAAQPKKKKRERGEGGGFWRPR